MVDDTILWHCEQKIDDMVRVLENSKKHFPEHVENNEYKLDGMLQIYWLIGGKGYQSFKPNK